MKILFTSVGKRVELMQAFKKAANDLAIDLTLIGSDLIDTAVALNFCDEIILTCRIDDAQYIPMLIKTCKTHSIDCLIPTIDTDLLKLAQNKEKFEKIGTKVFIASEKKVRLCRDKRQTTNYFISLGLESPIPIDNISKYASGFPAFIKPLNGSSSINAYKVKNREELCYYAKLIDNYIIQPFISGTEYTIDAFCDYEGNPVYITPRERLEVRAGEVLKTKIIKDCTIVNEMKILLQDYKPSGPITVQLIKDKVTGKNYYIEINPRFGGGAPLSMKAGADSAKATLKVLNNDKVNFIENAAKEELVFCRFDQSICVNGVI